MKSTQNLRVLVVLCVLVCFGKTQNTAKCVEGFRCQNGDCIKSYLLCDGQPNCKDESDETTEECMKPGIVCPEYAFRCAYGACIDGDKACNGIKDCRDNSDETLPQCGGVASNGTQCLGSQYKCDNGQCISGSGFCDGILNCEDGSDETYAACGKIICSGLAFRCDYGACIDGDMQCNGRKDCVDGSDEKPQVCNISTTTTTTTTTPRSTVSTSTKRCLVPGPPQNGQRKLHKSLCQSQEDCEVNTGVELAPGERLIYSCNPGYQLKGYYSIYCGSDGKWPDLPECTAIRCKTLSSTSTAADCRYNNRRVACDGPVSPQTTAKLSCRNGYHQQYPQLPREKIDLICDDNGQWDADPIRCVPDCGSTNAKPAVTLIVNGTEADIAEFPWHATLYKAETVDAEKEFICGASIIQENLLITAAHCVYLDNRHTIDNPNKYHIATGNVFQEFDSPLHDERFVRKVRVKNIYVPCLYLGLEGNYASDIAILEIFPTFKFSNVLAPICLDSGNDKYALEAGRPGKVAGFGRTATGRSSLYLQTLSVPYVPFNKCQSASVEHDTRKYITPDKFCAGYTNGSSVCDGDSGGGLVFKTDEQWFLRGVVSVGIGETITGGERSCDSSTYSLYTQIYAHMQWIQHIRFTVASRIPFTCDK